tara:strand:+ start:120 stop:374 length:255 start_codon:yes stop_codon:yes gene_type:complete
LVTLTEKEQTVVDEAYRYFVEQEHDVTKAEMYMWTARRMQKYMMADSPMKRKQLQVLDSIVLSLPWEDENGRGSNNEPGGATGS